ncbi:MAG: NTP transferase domain-containing protein, partial [Actinobacteria bacterium]|nr:NTP transferase domain-containing protein [Actinomycetota bacterium]
MPSLTAVILAAGQGTRMRSRLPKMLHPLCGRPLVGWPIAVALEAGADRVVVVDSPADTLEGKLPAGVTRVVQPEPDGTGGAVRAAAAEIDPDATVIVLPGDVPLMTAAAIEELVRAHAK